MEEKTQKARLKRKNYKTVLRSFPPFLKESKGGDGKELVSSKILKAATAQALAPTFKNSPSKQFFQALLV